MHVHVGLNGIWLLVVERAVTCSLGNLQCCDVNAGWMDSMKEQPAAAPVPTETFVAY